MGNSIIEINRLLQNQMGPGWEVVGPYFNSTTIVNIAGGTTAGATTVDVITESLAGGKGLYIVSVLPIVIDQVGIEFVSFGLRDSGQNIAAGGTYGYGNFAPVTLEGMNPYQMDAIVRPGGYLELVGSNYSGTEAAPSLYPASQQVRVMATMTGYYYAYTGVGVSPSQGSSQSLFATPSPSILQDPNPDENVTGLDFQFPAESIKI